jgi:tetratricopeptide (TPR) repeat protein
MALEARFEIPAVRNDLKRIRIPDVVSLLSLEMISDEHVAEYAGVGPVNAEDKPLLEYRAPRAFFANRGANKINHYDERRTFDGSASFLRQRIQTRPLTDEERLHIGLLHAGGTMGNAMIGYSVLSTYLHRHPDDLSVLSIMAGLAERLGRPEEQLEYLGRLAKLSPTDPAALEKFASHKFSFDRRISGPFAPLDTEVEERLLKRCVELTGDTVDYYHAKLADFYFGMQQFQSAADNYRRALQIREKYRPDPRLAQDALLLQLARSLRRLGRNADAAGYALQAVNSNPGNEEARDLFYSIWTLGSGVPSDTSKK